MVALLYLAAGATFFIGAWPTQANMRIIGLFSMLPFAAALVGAIRRPEVRSEATPLVNLSLISLALFLFLADGVLIAAVMKLNR
jgi:hypothetical protein